MQSVTGEVDESPSPEVTFTAVDILQKRRVEVKHSGSDTLRSAIEKAGLEGTRSVFARRVVQLDPNDPAFLSNISTAVSCGAQVQVTLNNNKLSAVQVNGLAWQELDMSCKLSDLPLQPLGENELRCLGDIDGVNEMFTKTLTGKTIRTELPAMATVIELKSAIQDREGIPVDQQRLVYGGMQLEDELPLAAYGIGDQSTLHLILRLRGGMYHASSGMEGLDRMRSEVEDVEIVTPFGTVSTAEIRGCPGRTFALQLLHYLRTR